MRTITAKEAFRAYEAVRHRLPLVARMDREPRHVPTLADLFEDFDVFLLDAFGVLNIGDAAVPETPERVAALQRAGKTVHVVSNAASVGRDTLVRKYRALGFDFAADDFITSRGTMAREVRRQHERNWGVMGMPDGDLSDLGPGDFHILGDDPSVYERVGGFLLIGSGSWTDARQSLLEAALRRRPRPVLVANPDIVAPREHGFSAEPGHFAHLLADRTTVDPIFFGKPFANIYAQVFDQLGDVERSRVLMVGDSLHTDILGARSAGIASALVANYGFFAGHDVRAAINECGIVPDFIVDHP